MGRKKLSDTEKKAKHSVLTGAKAEAAHANSVQAVKDEQEKHDDKLTDEQLKFIERCTTDTAYMMNNHSKYLTLLNDAFKSPAKKEQLGVLFGAANTAAKNVAAREKKGTAVRGYKGTPEEIKKQKQEKQLKHTKAIIDKSKLSDYKASVANLTKIKLTPNVDVLITCNPDEEDIKKNTMSCDVVYTKPGSGEDAINSKVEHISLDEFKLLALKLNVLSKRGSEIKTPITFKLHATAENLPNGVKAGFLKRADSIDGIVNAVNELHDQYSAVYNKAADERKAQVEAEDARDANIALLKKMGFPENFTDLTGINAKDISQKTLYDYTHSDEFKKNSRYVDDDEKLADEREMAFKKYNDLLNTYNVNRSLGDITRNIVQRIEDENTVRNAKNKELRDEYSSNVAAVQREGYDAFMNHIDNLSEEDYADIINGNELKSMDAKVAKQYLLRMGVRHVPINKTTLPLVAAVTLPTIDIRLKYARANKEKSKDAELVTMRENDYKRAEKVYKALRSGVDAVQEYNDRDSMMNALYRQYANKLDNGTGKDEGNRIYAYNILVNSLSEDERNNADHNYLQTRLQELLNDAADTLNTKKIAYEDAKNIYNNPKSDLNSEIIKLTDTRNRAIDILGKHQHTKDALLGYLKQQAEDTEKDMQNAFDFNSVSMDDAERKMSRLLNAIDNGNKEIAKLEEERDSYKNYDYSKLISDGSTIKEANNLKKLNAERAVQLENEIAEYKEGIKDTQAEYDAAVAAYTKKNGRAPNIIDWDTYTSDTVWESTAEDSQLKKDELTKLFELYNIGGPGHNYKYDTAKRRYDNIQKQIERIEQINTPRELSNYLEEGSVNYANNISNKLQGKDIIDKSKRGRKKSDRSYATASQILRQLEVKTHIPTDTDKFVKSVTDSDVLPKITQGSPLTQLDENNNRTFVRSKDGSIIFATQVASPKYETANSKPFQDVLHRVIKEGDDTSIGAVNSKNESAAKNSSVSAEANKLAKSLTKRELRNKSDAVGLENQLADYTDNSEGELDVLLDSAEARGKTTGRSFSNRNSREFSSAMQHAYKELRAADSPSVDDVDLNSFKMMLKADDTIVNKWIDVQSDEDKKRAFYKQIEQYWRSKYPGGNIRIDRSHDIAASTPASAPDYMSKLKFIDEATLNDIDKVGK